MWLELDAALNVLPGNCFYCSVETRDAGAEANDSGHGYHRSTGSWNR